MWGDPFNYDIKTFRKVWQYKLADFDRANDLLMDLDLDNIIDPSDMESSWLSWIQEFLRVMDECIPSSPSFGKALCPLTINCTLH